MTNCKRPLTASAIKYLLTLYELGGGERGVRSVDLAARMRVSKPSTHAMLQSLCAAGLAEKERYGAVRLSEAGRSAAALYRPVWRRRCNKARKIHKRYWTNRKKECILP